MSKQQSSSCSDLTKRREEFWKSQIGVAEKKGDLVDDHRFVLLRLLLTFHGLIIAALVFKDATPPSTAKNVVWIAIGIGFIGCALFTLIISQHTYMRKAKAWHEDLEKLIAASMTLTNEKPPARTGTFYLEDYFPRIPIEPTLVSLVALTTGLNAGIPLLVLRVIESQAPQKWLQSPSVLIWVPVTILAAHAAILLFMTLYRNVHWGSTKG